MLRSAILACLCAAAIFTLTTAAQAAPIDLSGVWAVRAEGGRVLCRSVDKQESFRATFNLQLKQSGATLEGYTDIGFAPAQGGSAGFFFGCPTRGLVSSSATDAPRGRALLQFAGLGAPAENGPFMGTVYVRHAETFAADESGRSGRLDGRYVARAPIGIIECRLHLVRVTENLDGRYPFDDGCILP